MQCIAYFKDNQAHNPSNSGNWDGSLAFALTRCMPD